MDELLKDARFAHMAKDPKFRRIPEAERKVKIDKRFQGMFKDKKFTVTYTTDKRGRPVNRSTAEDLRKYYDLSSSEEDEEEAANASDKGASVSSASEETTRKEKMKSTEHKKVKGKKMTVAKGTDSNSVSDSLNIASKSEQNNDDCSTSKENLEMKQKEAYDQYPDDKSEEPSSNSDDENIQKGFTQADFDENEKQLHKRRKNERSKLTSEIKERLKDLSVNYARGEGALLTDSSSEESSEASGNIIYIHCIFCITVAVGTARYTRLLCVHINM